MRNTTSFLSEDHRDAEALLELSAEYVFKKEIIYPKHISERETRALEQLRGQISLLIRSVLELRSVVEDIEMTYWMSRRYPWGDKKIKKSKHLELTWFLFVNLCYLFREKLKRYHNNLSNCAYIFDLKLSNWLKSSLTEVDNALGKHIKFRGQTVHEWNEYNINIHIYSMIELIESTGASNKFGNAEDHYHDAKFMISSDISEAQKAAKKVYIEALEADQNVLIRILKKFNNIMEIKFDANRSDKVDVKVNEGKNQ